MRYIRRKCAQQNLFEIRHKLETQILSTSFLMFASYGGIHERLTAT